MRPRNTTKSCSQFFRCQVCLQRFANLSALPWQTTPVLYLVGWYKVRDTFKEGRGVGAEMISQAHDSQDCAGSERFFSVGVAFVDENIGLGNGHYSRSARHKCSYREDAIVPSQLMGMRSIPLAMLLSASSGQHYVPSWDEWCEWWERLGSK